MPRRKKPHPVSVNTPFTQLPKTAVLSVQLPALQAACARFVTLDGMPAKVACVACSLDACVVRVRKPHRAGLDGRGNLCRDHAGR